MLKMADQWRRYKTEADSEAREQIIMAYAYLAKYVVDRMPLKPNAVTGYDDLLSHAIVGLIDAVEKFDPSREIKFETYAITRIRGAVLDAIKSLDWMPRSVRSSEQELRRVFAGLEARLGRSASDEEVAHEMGVDLDTLYEKLSEVGHSALISFEEVMLYGEDSADESASGGWGTVSPLGDPVLAIEADERGRILADAIADLPDREKLVISLYYSDGLTLKEIAKVLGVTESRACQLHSKAVVRLHGKLGRHKDLLLAAA